MTLAQSRGRAGPFVVRPGLLLQCSKCVTDRQGETVLRSENVMLGVAQASLSTVQNRPISLDTGGIEMMMKQHVLVVKAHGALIK